MMPLVGLINGLIGFGIFMLLTALDFSSFFKAVIMCLYFIIFTGGLHIDGLMDTADAYFSRRDKERKLEIMKDSNVGAFAVITLIFVLLLKVAFLNELFIQNNKNSILIVFIPIISRLLQSSMLYLFSPAKPEGLTRMYGKLDKRFSLLLFGLLVMVVCLLVALVGIKSLLLIGVILIYYALFYLSSKKQFGGITGDLLGAFLEISELIMLGTLIFI
jgi:adenosylcobinamide-GDP ribazoletransferase